MAKAKGSGLMGKLSGFTLLALGAAGLVKLAMLVHDQPPGSSVYALAPGQTSSAIGIDALGAETHFFSMGEKGLDLTVLAPKDSQFEFSNGTRSDKARFTLAPNSRKGYSFAILKNGESTPTKRVVEFRSWMLPSASALPANATRLSHMARSGKYTHTEYDGVSFRYALAAGQTSARLELPWAGGPGATSDHGAIQEVTLNVLTRSPMRAVLVAPPAMRFLLSNGVKTRDYEFEAPAHGRVSMRFDILDSAGATTPMDVHVVTDYAPGYTPPRPSGM